MVTFTRGPQESASLEEIKAAAEQRGTEKKTELTKKMETAKKMKTAKKMETAKKDHKQEGSEPKEAENDSDTPSKATPVVDDEEQDPKRDSPEPVTSDSEVDESRLTLCANEFNRLNPAQRCRRRRCHYLHLRQLWARFRPQLESAQSEAQLDSDSDSD